MEELAKAISRRVSPSEIYERLDEANVKWTEWHVRNTKGKRLRLGLEVARTLAEYCAYETSLHGEEP